ncbi:MAG: radical SAM protein [Candidatus Aenigmatarchaeota archaeon]
MMLDRYSDILNGRLEPYYLQAKDRGEDHSGYRMGELWTELEQQKKEGVPSLQLKKELADRILENCEFCERRCGVDRKRGESGTCAVSETLISSEFLHMGEERELVPSHTVFFAGCNFKCVFCQNHEISQLNQGRRISPGLLAEKIQNGGGKNVNWVGGDPTPNIPYILEVLEHLSRSVPQIWNSNLYLSEEGMEILSQLMDVYLTDFKYWNEDCAERLSKVENYTEVVKRNHLIAEETGDLIIRHLVLPGHIECCTKPLLEWIDSNLESPRVNIMSQYRPVWHADQYDDIGRYLSAEEKREIRRLRRKYSHLGGER